MKKLIILILACLLSSPLQSQIWEKADGPYQFTSAFRILSFNNELYFFGSFGGIYKKNTDNDDWLKQDTGFFADKGIIYYINQKDNVVITTTQVGVYWSYDYGKTWKFSDEKWYGNNFGFPYVAILDQTIFVQTYNTSLYKIERGSDTFEKIYPDAEKKDSIYADVIITKDNYIFSADPRQYSDRQPEYGKLYISSDKGETWSLSKSMRKYIINLLFHNDILFAFTKDDGLFKSTDFGITWTTDTSIHINGKKVISYKDLIFACSYQVLVSSDDGNSWETLNDGLGDFGCEDILINNDKLYYLTSHNLTYTFDNDKRYWNIISPLTDDFRQYKIIEAKDTLFSVGGFTINYSIDDGASWDMYSDSLYFRSAILRYLYIQDSIYVAVDQRSTYMLISSDYGKSWRYEDLGIFTLDSWVNYAIIMGNRILLTSITKGNYYSKDAGLTWELYDNDVLTKDTQIYNYIRLSDTRLIIYSKVGLYKSNDNGISWEFEKTNEEVKIHGNTTKDGDNLYTRDFTNNSIYKSTDLGRTWKELEVNIDSKLSWVRLISYNGYLILFTTTDVYVSNNDGKDWNKYAVDLLRPNGKELYFEDGIVSDDYLVLASGYGIWRAKLSDLGIEVKTSVESEIEGNYLYTYPPYPNPAKSEVKVLFYWDINLPMTTDDISIYDITGKKIDAVGNISLVKQESHNGNIIWDCSSAQPGIYLINIKHGTVEKTVKVVVE